MACGYFVAAPGCLCLAVRGAVVPTLRERELYCQGSAVACGLAEAREELGASVPWDLYELLVLSPPDRSTCARLLTHALELLAIRERELRAHLEPTEWRIAAERLRDAALLLDYALDGRPAPEQAASAPSRLSAPAIHALGAVVRALRWFARQVDGLAVDGRDDAGRRAATRNALDDAAACFEVEMAAEAHG
jgi:hypothetical protein